MKQFSRIMIPGLLIIVVALMLTKVRNSERRQVINFQYPLSPNLRQLEYCAQPNSL
jgi:hypothetical protein